MLSIHQFYRPLKKYWLLSIISFVVVITSFIPTRIAITSYQAPNPQAILTLGGGPEREKFTAKFAQHYPNLDIWVSSGVFPAQAFAIFHNYDISTDRIHLDYQAVDTVTNITTITKYLQQRHIQHTYLITSDFHIPRATIIATLVLGSQGIIFTPVALPTQRSEESMFPIVRDAGRALLWIVSGRTGASFHHHFRNTTYASL
ncbi:MAG: YdcF family protein [Sphaerospermopsis sp. SIO1G2]|nr:YdcF family protein [Sphaerospermopsis sp. SIO1G2]